MAGRNIDELPPSSDVIEPRGTTAPPILGDTRTCTSTCSPPLHMVKGMAKCRSVPVASGTDDDVVVEFEKEDDTNGADPHVLLLSSLSGHEGTAPPTAMALNSSHAG